MIPIHIVSGRGLIYDVDVIRTLREDYHVCGVLSGILPQFPQQNIFGGLPLQLLPEDVQLLLESGEFYLVDDSRAHLEAVADGESSLEAPEVFQGALAVVPAQSQFKDPSRLEHLPPPEVIKPKPERYQIYKYLMDRGFFLMPGLRFGCQFMAYPGDLMRYHSHYNVVGYGWDQPFPILDIIGAGRLATSVKKCWVVGAVNPEDNETQVFSIEWAGFG